MRRWGVFAAVFLVVLLAGGSLVAADGGVETFGTPSSAAGWSPASAPAWTAPCWERKPRADRRLLERCARVRGRVIWVQSDGPDDVHVAVLAHWRVISVRIPKDQDNPGALEGVTAVGALVRDRTGVDELDAVVVE